MHINDCCWGARAPISVTSLDRWPPTAPRDGTHMRDAYGACQVAMSNELLNVRRVWLRPRRTWGFHTPSSLQLGFERLGVRVCHSRPSTETRPQGMVFREARSTAYTGAFASRLRIRDHWHTHPGATWEEPTHRRVRSASMSRNPIPTVAAYSVLRFWWTP